MTGPRIAKLLQIIIGLLRPQQVELFAPLAWIASGDSFSCSRRKRRRVIGWFGLVESPCHQFSDRNGRFGPRARQLEIFFTASGIVRQLSRPNTVLGMVLIKLLQCCRIL